ncbi:PEGA domain-containing protein [Patescibacteria group bacterium]|nr:PEGA domain-containing protein [Patescibacteria group bacterium]MBU1890117.1 PEGA domain-containing protein [Patescibacteria group bacterium]
MTRQTRKIILTLFIALFFIVAPILMYYTAGYRYDWGRKKIIKTGVISVETQPHGAQVILNGQKLGKKTPTTIANLLPGDYSIEVTKEDYLTWKNNISVKTDNATVIPEIILFKDASSLLISNKKVVQVLETNKDNISLIIAMTDDGYELSRYNYSSHNDEILLSVTNEMDIESSIFNNLVIISTKSNGVKKFQLLDINENQVTTISSLPQDIYHLEWISQDLVFVLSNGMLCKIGLTDNSKTCIAHTVTDFTLINNHIYYLTNSDSTGLFQTPSIDMTPDRLITYLPLSDNYKFTASTNQHLALIDKQTEDIYIINPNESQLNITRFSRSAKDAFWLNDNSSIVYYNDFEVWLWHVNETDPILITRVSEPINQVMQYSDYAYLLLSQSKKIQSIELETCSHTRKMTPLIENAGSTFFLDQDNKTIIYTGSDQQKLWSRIIR